MKYKCTVNMAMTYREHVSLGIPIGTFSRSFAQQFTCSHDSPLQEQRAGQLSATAYNRKLQRIQYVPLNLRFMNLFIIPKSLYKHSEFQNVFYHEHIIRGVFSGEYSCRFSHIMLKSLSTTSTQYEMQFRYE